MNGKAWERLAIFGGICTLASTLAMGRDGHAGEFGLGVGIFGIGLMLFAAFMNERRKKQDR